MSEAQPPKWLGDFELLREVGRGGMGIVYDARQVSLNRRVALKILPPGLGLTAQAVKRFEREAQAAAKLHHTNIVPVHAIGEEDGCHYYAMELIEGQPLSDVLRDLGGSGSNPVMDATVTIVNRGEKHAGPARDPETADRSPGNSGITSLSDSSSGSRQWFDAVARLVAEVAEALEYAHGRGVTHRDIKPANLMLSDAGRLCITDFGLARVAQEPGMTVSGSLMGTPAYMSPEQITAGRVKLDHRTDVYSLGAVLYEMLTYRRPFPGESREEILTGILTKDPRPPRRFNPRIPVDLETICLKAMEKDPDRRYATAGEMAADLKRYVERGLITARRAGPLRRAAKAMRRHPVAVTIAIAATLLVATAGSLTWVFSVRQSAEVVRRAMADARLSLGEGEYGQALRSVEEALAADPDLAEGRIVRARLLMNLGRVVEAVDEARALLERDRDDWKAHAILAAAAKLDYGETVLSIDARQHVAAVESGAPETAEAYYLRALVTDSPSEALELLDRALEIDPGNVEALVRRIHGYQDMKDFTAALADCERLVAMRPRSARARRLTAGVHLEQNDTDSAMAEVGRAIEIDPTDPWNYYVRGDVFDRVGRLEEAVADLTRAIEIDPDRMMFFRRRFYLQKDRRYQFALAAADAERAVELEPDNPAARWSLISAKLALGDLEGAMGEVSRLFEMSEGWPDKSEGALEGFFLAEKLSQVGEFERAREIAGKALEWAPEEWTSHLAVAIVESRAGDPAAAAESCARASAFELYEPGAYRWRAFWFGATSCPGAAEQAVADYSKAIELAPLWADPWSGRAGVHATAGRLVEAVADLDKAIERAPRDGDLYLDRAWAYVAMEDRYEEALTDCDKAIELGSAATAWRNPLYLKATLLQRLGRADEALGVMQRAVEEQPESGDAHAFLAMVAFELGRIDEALAATGRRIELQPTDLRALFFHAMLLTFKTEECQRVRAALEKVWELGAQLPDMWIWVAWGHAVHLVYACPDLYDPVLALELARKALVISPWKGTVKDQLGIVLYRNGLYEEARTVLLEVMTSGHMHHFEREPPETLFSLAMTSWKLGREREARRYFDRAVAAMDRTMPANPEYIRRRDEAAELLGVPR